MRERIPGIIHQISTSIPNITEEEKTAFDALAHTIGSNGEVEDRTDSSSLLGEFFRVKVARSIHTGLHWHSISWWLAENYEYFLLNQIHAATKRSDQPDDLFWYLKTKGLEQAIPLFEAAVTPLLQHALQEDALSPALFRQALLRNLWGNKADLSMSGGVVSQKELRSDATNLLLVDDVDAVWQYVVDHAVERVAIMADNTGFEVLCDFLLMALLLHFRPAMHLCYIVKAAPVFVSDVTLADIEPTLCALASSSCLLFLLSLRRSPPVDRVHAPGGGAAQPTLLRRLVLPLHGRARVEHAAGLRAPAEEPAAGDQQGRRQLPPTAGRPALGLRQRVGASARVPAVSRAGDADDEEQRERGHRAASAAASRALRREVGLQREGGNDPVLFSVACLEQTPQL